MEFIHMTYDETAFLVAVLSFFGNDKLIHIIQNEIVNKSLTTPKTSTEYSFRNRRQQNFH